jgi:AcrR family transcriptional regulator
VAFGKPGRPREDRLLRQREIFGAVAPLVLERGVRRVTMRDAARAAYLSVGALYHYFPTKRDLLLHALTQEALDRFCTDFLKDSFGLKSDDPRAFLDAYAEFCGRASSSGPQREPPSSSGSTRSGRFSMRACRTGWTTSWKPFVMSRRSSMMRRLSSLRGRSDACSSLACSIVR